MPRVLIADELAPSATEVLSRVKGFEVVTRSGLSPEALADVIGDYDAVLVRRPSRLTAELLDRADNLKLIGRAGIAVDSIDVDAATRRGVVVLNTPFGNATTVAEHAIGLMFALARSLPAAAASMQRGEWGHKALVGRQLAGKTLGVIGLGTVGRLVARKGAGLGMTVIGHDPGVDESVVQRTVEIEVVSFAELFQRADFISVHVPLTERTERFIGEAAFVAMKPDACLINCARGGLVDEAALIAALDSGAIAGAALDVFEQMPLPADHPLRRHPKVIATPHLSAQTPEALDAVSRQIAEQTRDFFVDGVIQHAVNVPPLSREQRRRLAPHMALAERLGSMAGQLLDGAATKVRLVVSGDLDPDDVAPLRARALAGLLAASGQARVNAVSAEALARAAGIEVAAVARDGETDFSNLVRIEVKGTKGQVQIEGAVFGRHELRVVGVDGHRLDLVPEGHILAIRNANRPGVIGAVGSTLGAHAINVARITLGLRQRDGEAMALWATDTQVPDAVLTALGELDGILGIRRLVLPTLPG